MKRLVIVLILAGLLLSVVPPVYAQMPVSQSQMALAGNTAFRLRCAYTLAQIAMTVRAESVGTANHALRDALARYILADPQGYADKIAPVIVGLTNVVAAGTTVAADGTVTSNVTDAALLSQLTSVWNILAGV